MKKNKSSSILKKFLAFNFLAFIILGLFTFFYLKAIQPNLVDQRTEKHNVIINNTSNHVERLKISFDKESIKNFLLSTRFLFQNLERVQFYNLDGDLLADTNVFDLDQSVFSKSSTIFEENINNESITESENKQQNSLSKEIKKEEDNQIKNLISKKIPKVELTPSSSSTFIISSINLVFRTLGTKPAPIP